VHSRAALPCDAARCPFYELQQWRTRIAWRRRK